MPQQVQVTERYWCPGPWPWEWFDTCTRTVTKWCYNFSWVEETGYFFFSYLKGCENGVEYSWYAFSFGIVGATYYGPGRLCFDTQLSVDGKCASGAVGRLKVTADAPRVQGLARRRVRGPVHRGADDEGADDRGPGDRGADDRGSGVREDAARTGASQSAAPAEKEGREPV